MFLNGEQMEIQIITNLLLWHCHNLVCTITFCPPSGKIHLRCPVFCCKECTWSSPHDRHCLGLFSPRNWGQYLLHTQNTLSRISWRNLLDRKLHCFWQNIYLWEVEHRRSRWDTWRARAGPPPSGWICQGSFLRMIHTWELLLKIKTTLIHHSIKFKVN